MKNVVFIYLVMLTVIAAQSQGFIRSEYFFDADPGVGKGIVLPLTDNGENVSQVASINTSALSSGFHILGLRFMRQDGIWTQTEARGFYISVPAPVANPITAAEYFIDQDPGVGKGNPVAVNFSTPALLDTFILSMGALPLGKYTVGFRVKNAGGKWSLTEHRLFEICTVKGPLSMFNHHVEFNRVFFENQSSGADSLKWMFGDNTSDTVLNPIKTYNGAGAFTVKLISKNVCGTDTAAKTVLVNGLQYIYGSSGGDSGIATITFNGIGFTPATTVQLQKENLVLTPESFQLLSPTSIAARFYFNKVPLGNYHAIANMNGGSFDTLKNAYTIVSYKQPQLRISGEGPRFSRPGNQFRSYYIHNNGSEDVVMVPVVLRMGFVTGNFSPQIYPQDGTLNLQNEGIFKDVFQYLEKHNISTDVMSAFSIDTARHRQLFASFRVKVPAYSTVKSGIQVLGSSGNITYGLSAVLHSPMYHSGLTITDQQSPVKDCMNSFLRKAVRQNISTEIDFEGWNNCFNEAFDTLTGTIQHFVDDFSKSQRSIPMQAVFSSLLSQILQCGNSGIPVAVSSAAFKQTITDVTYNWIYWENLDSLGRPCFDTTESFVFKRSVNGLDKEEGGAASTLETAEEVCPKLAAYPELLDQCLPFLEACGLVDDMENIDNAAVLSAGKKFLTRPKTLMEKFCQVNSGSAFCEKMCEITSIDPNIKFGPGDNFEGKHINHLGSSGYTIFFENLASAPANAAFVEVADTIDMEKFDISTFRLGTIGWADSTIQMDPGRTNFSAFKNLRPLMPNNLRIDFRLDTVTGIANWRFYTLDTITQQLTINPFEGFLPPNVNGREGMGFVSFSIAPKHGVVTSGTVLQNKATIIFDENEPIITPVWEHVIDTTRPQSHVIPLPAVSNETDFVVHWAGSDAHAGIASYCVYVSINDSAFVKWKDFTTALSDTFHGKYLNTYKFYSRALDKANNFEKSVEDPLGNPDAVITLEAVLPVYFINFSAVKSVNPDRVKLAWKAANETTADRYVIERSNDGRKFLAIGSISATRNAGNNSYLYVDSIPGEGKNFYRLRQVDTDGSFVYTHILVINFGTTNGVGIYPSITNGYFSVNGALPGAAMQIIDMQGRVVQKRILKSPAEYTDISSLPAGVYMVQVLQKGSIESFKILKQ